jgi:hypothetical protein
MLPNEDGSLKPNVAHHDARDCSKNLHKTKILPNFCGGLYISPLILHVVRAYSMRVLIWVRHLLGFSNRATERWEEGLLTVGE